MVKDGRIKLFADYHAVELKSNDDHDDHEADCETSINVQLKYA